MAALKSLFVTNTFDGSEDHLVSGKLFCLIGIDMLSFRAELLMQQHPETLEGVVRKLIPPKEIKRKEFEGPQFFTDFTDPEEADVVSEVEESEMSDTDANLQENVNEANTVNQVPFRTVILQGAVSQWTIQILTKMLNFWMTFLASSVIQK